MRMEKKEGITVDFLRKTTSDSMAYFCLGIYMWFKSLMGPLAGDMIVSKASSSLHLQVSATTSIMQARWNFLFEHQ